VPKDFFLPQVDAIALGEAEVMFRELGCRRGRPAGNIGFLLRVRAGREKPRT
jgi:hypothetical protein